ncbi:MAG TPA: HlyD family type I secretion periplasmic adaptor subunit [Sphingomonadaceae bacterium]|nr:HlyD family type I secretion periplasmic adaptor subunit [Sphingomonadaceae bacterium]
MNAHVPLEERARRVRPRDASSVLLWGTALFFVVFVVWAALTELDRTVRGAGRVVASSQLQVVSNLEGGIVEAIFVRTGQLVQRGAELVRLDQTQSGSDFGSGQAALNALGAKIARLKAEVAGREPVYPRPSDRASAEQIEIERALHMSRMAELASLTSGARARTAGAERAVAEAEAAYQSRLSSLAGQRAQIAIIRPLVDRGIEPRMQLAQLESAAAVAASDAAAAAAARARAVSAVGEARASAAQIAQDWRARAAAEFATAQAELSARRSAMPALAERVERTIVRAPLAGRVNRVLVTTVGGSIAPGAPLVEIVPSQESLVIEAKVRAQDIASVRLDQPARVEVTAYDPSIYGGLPGTVIAISPDALVDEQTRESFYTVQVRTLANALVDKAGRRLPIGPGMVANVNLIGDKRTVLEYILSPITRLQETAFRE